MAIKAVWCPLVQSHVGCVTDLEGALVKVVCAERDEATHLCRIKQAAAQAGPLSQLLARASRSMLTDRTLRCLIG